MATITIKPSAAQDYQGSTVLTTTNHWIGRPLGYAQACTVRYTFKPTKNLKKFTARITGTLYGEVDGKFRYCLSTSSSLPTTWTAVTTEGDGYLAITHTGKLEANKTYYLFVTKETSGNYVYYAGCSAENVTITGEVAGAGHVYRNGAWKDLTPKVYRNGAWKDATAKEYSGGWGELS